MYRVQTAQTISIHALREEGDDKYQKCGII